MEYKQKKLSELVNGEAFEGFLLVKSAAVRTGSTGKNYLDLSLADDKTAINAKVWDYYEALSRIAANDLVKVRATVTVWQNVLQLRIEKIRLATKEDPARIEDFVPSAPQSGDSLAAAAASYRQDKGRRPFGNSRLYSGALSRKAAVLAGGHVQPPRSALRAAVSHPYHAPCGRSAVLGVYKS